MRLVLISYFYEPARNVAAERWTRFALELKKRGHEITIITGPWAGAGQAPYFRQNDTYYLPDPFSEDAVRFTEASPVKPRYLRKLARRVLPGFLLIDGKWRWTANAMRLLPKLLTSSDDQRKVDLVLVTGTPWSSVAATALGALVWRYPYAVDFRDYWANEAFLPFGGKIARAYFRLLERFTARHARQLFTVNEPMVNYFSRLAPGIPVTALPHGFAGPVAFTRESFNSVADRAPEILYAGSVSDFHGLQAFLEELRPLEGGKLLTKLRFIGIDHTGVCKKWNLRHEGQFDAAAAETQMEKAAFLLITLDAKSTHYTTGKLLTYIKTGRPILYFGPSQSPAAKLIRDLGIGWVVDCTAPAQLHGVAAEISGALSGALKLKFQPNFGEIAHYSLEAISARLALALEGPNDHAGKENKVSGPDKAARLHSS